MPKIFAPVKDYNGITASVPFVNGVGETDDPWLIEWFENHGYTVEGKGDTPEPKADDEKSLLEKMKATELRDMAREKGIEGYSQMNKEELIKALSELSE